MKLLIIEDDDAKAHSLESAAREVYHPGADLRIDRSRSLSSAATNVSTHDYDVILLDLLLPYVEGIAPSSNAGVEMLRVIRDPSCRNRGATLVGISAFPEEISSRREAFERAGVLMVSYSDNEAWRQTLSNALRLKMENINSYTNLDFLIVCALEKERHPYNALLKECKHVLVDDLNVLIGRTPGGRQGAVLRLSDMGVVPSTYEATVALERFQPRLAAMSGICAGIRGKAEFGEIVVASPTWEYQAGKWSENGFEIGAYQVPLASTTAVTIDHHISQKQFSEALEEGLDESAARPPKRFRPKLAPMATGSAVVADKERLGPVVNQHRKLAAIDMEMYGFYYACVRSKHRLEHFFGAKAVVDLADAAKGDELHPYGCFVSARAVTSLLDLL